MTSDEHRSVAGVAQFNVADMLRDLRDQSQLVGASFAALYGQASVMSALREALIFKPMPPIGEILRLHDSSTRLAAQQIMEFQHTAQLISTAVNMHAEQFAQVRALIEGVRFISPSLDELRSPLMAIAANGELIRRAFEGLRRDVETLRAIALRPTWELWRLTREMAFEVGGASGSAALVATRTMEAAALETTRTSEILSAIMRRQRAWIVDHPAPPPALPTFNLFEVQGQEIRRLARSTLADRVNLEALPSVVPAKLARFLCHLVTSANDIAIANGHNPIFRPTNRLVEGAASLGFIVAISRRTFEDLVNLLFQMLYEGSGAASRLTEHLSDEELLPLWVLKRLRLSAFHDVEHGQDRDVAEKQLKIADAFRLFIGRPAPQSEEDYRAIQVGLLEKLIHMLEALRSKL